MPAKMNIRRLSGEREGLTTGNGGGRVLLWGHENPGKKRGGELEDINGKGDCARGRLHYI